MKDAAELARQLFRRGTNDLLTAQIGLQHGAPLDTVCFHIQQAAEKLLKAALGTRDLEYPFTHDLRELVELALPTTQYWNNSGILSRDIRSSP